MTDEAVLAGRITHAELVEMFGATMPIEAVNILTDSASPAEARAAHREMQARMAAPEGLLERADETAGHLAVIAGMGEFLGPNEREKLDAAATLVVQLAAGLAAAEKAGAKLAQVEPSEEMSLAGVRALRDTQGLDDQFARVCAVYQAMLKASR